ncbi:hypothetical protein Ahy_B03g063399 [Arachis hypogaea]|uniref:SWIM-type domain-containing protein n=1 Tax=Arachis hypogaea TaxID=3818 RepID=A0A444ZX80_ARAHY|nr:hypothetical protein Ahy_B03g063399 [Arachis hypogaea]
MALFNMRMHHDGVFGYENDVLKYLKGQATIVEDIDDDRWSVFEAYEELRQLGYLKSTIAVLWYKDPTEDDYESQLKLLKGDTEAIEMCTIAGKRGFVDLFVVHEVGDAEGFPKAGYLDVRGETRGVENEEPLRGGLELVMFEGNAQKTDGIGVAAEVKCQNKDGGMELGQEGHEGDSDHDSSGKDSDDPTYLPSNEEESSVEDIYFTDSEEVYDYESGFGEDNSVPKDANAEKGKNVVTSDLNDEDAVDSDELEQDHIIGGHESGADDVEEAVEGEGQRFSVHKSQNDMENYQWKVGTLYESRQEFKDTVAAYAVHTARNIKFKKCDLVRVPAVCQKGCPFWLYAHRIGEEFTWKLRSMNLQHTCMQTHRVGIMHSKWLGTQFKKKVESNPRIKVKELVARAQKKWNLTVMKAMAAKTKQEALSQIQGAFREQYKRINDYCHELLRTNPGSTVILKVMCGLDKYIVDLAAGDCSCRKWQMSGILCPHAISCITFKGLDLESYVDDCYKKEAYLRRPSHRPVKKRKRGPADEDNRSQTHLSRRDQVQSSGREKEEDYTITNQPASSSAQENPPRPKKSAGRPTTLAPQPKKGSTQPNILAYPKNKVPAAATSTCNKQPLSQPSVRKRHFSVIQSSSPHIPLQKLRLMAKLPPSQCGNL